MWVKLKRTRPAGGKEKRKTPAVCRTRTGAQGAFAVFPEGMMPVGRADIYADGSRIAFCSSSSGKFAVSRSSKTSKATRVTIPIQFADFVPFGMTDVEMAVEGDMLVLDLTQIKRENLAAE